MVEIYIKGRFKDDSIKNFRLARIRAYRNLTMKEISREAGITLSHYSAIESMRCYPTDNLKIKISSVLKEDADYLFPERFREYCSENYARLNGTSEDVLDKLNRVRLDSEDCRELIDQDSEDDRELIEAEDRTEYIIDLLNKMNLTEKKRVIFNLRFGFKDRKPQTFRESGAVFHATRERAQQVELEVIQELRHPTRLRKLEELFFVK